MRNSTYAAWALYTGPEAVEPLWENSRWVGGQWNGENNNISAEEIKKDIDARIKCIKKAFIFTRSQLSNEQKLSNVNYFVIPEFYFHCKQGPYPNVRIEGKLDPYEYVCENLPKELKNDKDIALLENENWIICAGSMLTCNLQDYDSFLKSDEVQERLNVLNKAMAKLQAENTKMKKNHSKMPKVHIKALSYTIDKNNSKDMQSDTEQSIDDLMTLYRANPLCVVRNRGLVFKLNETKCVGYEKQNESTVDLTMGIIVHNDIAKQLEIGGMITEWMAGYPSISIINGDKHCCSTPLAARISGSDLSDDLELQLGIEICLDHRLRRLRRTCEMLKANGAEMDNPPLDIQLIPSGGMQILDYSVAAGVNGVIFNSDGCDPILNVYTSEGKQILEGSGTFKQITCGVYASSAQTMVEKDNKRYYSHSQLSFRYGNEEMDGFNNALGNKNKNGATFDPATKVNEELDAYGEALRIKVEDGESQGLFAAGLGELHLYIKKAVK